MVLSQSFSRNKSGSNVADRRSKQSPLLRTAEVATLAGVNVETLRYYERRGLLEEPPRDSAGYRRYPEAAVGRVQQIKVLQHLGFSLDDIASLLALSTDSPLTCEELSQLARVKLGIIEAKLADLQGIRDSLVEIVHSCCEGTHDDSVCSRTQYFRPTSCQNSEQVDQ